MKKTLIKGINIPTIDSAEDILLKAGSEDIFEKARQVGDIHPNGKFVWTEYAPGKFGWRVLKSRVRKKFDEVVDKNRQKYNEYKKRKLRPIGTGTLGPTKEPKDTISIKRRQNAKEQ